MTDDRFQDDELEFDDEFVLEDVELDADEFLDEPAEGVNKPHRIGADEVDPARLSALPTDGDPGPDQPELQLSGCEPEQEQAAEAEQGSHEDRPVDAEPETDTESGAEFGLGWGDPAAEVGSEQAQDAGDGIAEDNPLGWGAASDAEPAKDAVEGPESDLFQAAGPVDADERRFDESGSWQGHDASFEEIVGEAEGTTQTPQWQADQADEELDVEDFDALENVEIEHVDGDDAVAADDWSDQDAVEPESLVELVESASEVEPVFAAEQPELRDDDLDGEGLSFDGLDLDAPATARLDQSDEDPFEAVAESESGWDLTVRADGSPTAQDEEPEASTPTPEETFVVVDQDAGADDADADAASGGFGSGRFEQPFAADPTLEIPGMETPQGEGWESVELGAAGGGAAAADDEAAYEDESWEVNEQAPEDYDPEADFEDDPIYGEDAEGGAEAAAEEYWEGDDEADWSELEESYVDGDEEHELQVIGGPGSRRGAGRWLAAAAVLLLTVGGGFGALAVYRPDLIGWSSSAPVGVQRIAVQRPDLKLDLVAPTLEVRLAAADEGPTGASIETPPEDTLPVVVDPVGEPGDPVDQVVEVGPVQTPDDVGDPAVDPEPQTGSGVEVAAGQPTEREFEPIPVGENFEIRGPAPRTAGMEGEMLRLGMRAWAQLANEAVFVGTVSQLDASFVTLSMETGEITLDRGEIVSMMPVTDAEQDPVEIENGFVRLGENGTLFGKILRNNSGDHVVLRTEDSRISLPLKSIDGVGVHTDAGIVVVADDDEWLEQRALRRLNGGDPQGDSTPAATGPEGAQEQTRGTLPVMPATPPASRGR